MLTGSRFDICIAYLELDSADQDHVVDILIENANLPIGAASPQHHRSKSIEDMRARCYSELENISKQLADAWDLWASRLVATGIPAFHFHLAVAWLADALIHVAYVECDLLGLGAVDANISACPSISMNS